MNTPVTAPENRTPFSIRTSLLAGGALALAVAACSGQAEFEPAPSADESVASSGEEIINGTTALLDPRVVKVRRANSDGTTGLCTGTLLRSNIVLTAKHCVGSAGGVWRRHYIVPSGSTTTVEVSNPSSNVVEHPDVDLALMRLDQHVSIPTRGNLNYWTPLYEGSLSALEGNSANCQGYGHNVCGGGGGGTQRVAAIEVSEASATTIEYIPGDTGRIQAPGDSGGPCFYGANQEQLGVNRTGDDECEYARQTPVKTHSAWIRRQVALMQDPDEYEFTAQSDLNKFDIVDLPGSAGGPSSWAIVSNPPLSGMASLVQHSNINAPGSIAVMKGNVISDVYVETVVYTDDNDSASVVLRYKDPNNFYRMTVWGSASPSSTGIWRVKDGQATKIASCAGQLTAATRIVGAAINKQLAMVVIDAATNDTICSTDVVSGDFRDGRVGLMTNGLDEAEFEYISVESNPEP